MPLLNITTATAEVQAAVITTLTGNTAHMALVTGVYDAVPQTTAFPYEAIGALSENWADGFTDGFRKGMLQMDVWSRYHGRKEAQTIQASQIGLLNRAALSLATLHLVYFRLDYSDALLDPDGITWHGVCRYEWLVEATS